MIPGIICPTGNLGGLTPHQVLCSPIAAVDVAVGDLVMFDLAGVSTTYTDVTKITDLDNKKSPFNVVIKSVPAAATGAGHGGVFAVVTTAAVAGARCVVCVNGLVDAKVAIVATSGISVAGVTVLTNGTGVLTPSLQTPAATLNGAALGVGFTSATSAGTITMKVLFNGYTFAIGGA
jgi:hypothetical protein